MTPPRRHASRRAAFWRLRTPHGFRAVLYAVSCAAAVSACASASEPLQLAREATAMTTFDNSVLPAETSIDNGCRVSVTRHQMLAAALVLLAMLIPAQAFASGVIGPLPILPQEFRDFAACKAYLEEQYAGDRIVVADTASAAGREMPERSLETQDVVQTGDSEARYEVELGYLSKVVVDELKAVRSQYSYERRAFACNDQVLTGTETRGYHIETYEPLE